jgi:hypothetical protein
VSFAVARSSGLRWGNGLWFARAVGSRSRWESEYEDEEGRREGI